MVKSFCNKIWNFLEAEQQTVDKIRAVVRQNLLAKILANRGFENIEEVNAFINAKLRNTIPDPSLLLDMDKAVERVIMAIQHKQNIMVLGDYDVDGITSTALMVKYLRLIGVNPKYYIPNRFSDGYGVSQNAISKAIEKQSELVIAVDAGTNSISEIEEAKKHSIDFVILDHHTQLADTLPQAIAIVNPNRNDQSEIGFSYIKHLCAAGVVFLFLIALQRKLKEIGFFTGKVIPNLLDFADIVALGTLCDVMELRGINRAIVKYVLTKGEYSLGIRSLMPLFNLDNIASPEDLSFFIGPAINAAGRVGDPHVALNLLLEEDTVRSQKIATCLIELNQQRKSIERQLFADAINMISSQDIDSKRGICVYGDNWNEGVIGIVAGKLKDKFQKPTFVISITENGTGRGSARSVNGIHLGQFLQKATIAGIITAGGGHALAGGFSIEKDNIGEFQRFIEEQIEGEFINELNIDYTLTAMSDLDAIYEEIAYLEPFGKGVEKPIFCFKRVKISNIRKSKSGEHLLLNFSGEFGNSNIRAILFHLNSKKEFVALLEKNSETLLDIAGTINPSLQFGSSIIIEDARVSADYT